MQAWLHSRNYATSFGLHEYTAGAHGPPALASLHNFASLPAQTLAIFTA
jgi:hypothetical protein